MTPMSDEDVARLARTCTRLLTETGYECSICKGRHPDPNVTLMVSDLEKHTVDLPLVGTVIKRRDGRMKRDVTARVISLVPSPQGCEPYFVAEYIDSDDRYGEPFTVSLSVWAHIDKRTSPWRIHQEPARVLYRSYP